MSNLFIINSSPFSRKDVEDCFTRCFDLMAIEAMHEEERTGLIFIQNAVVAAKRGNSFERDLFTLHRLNVTLYVLKPDARARGITSEQLIPVFREVDMEEFVDLVMEEFEKVATWT